MHKLYNAHRACICLGVNGHMRNVLLSAKIFKLVDSHALIPKTNVLNGWNVDFLYRDQKFRWDGWNNIYLLINDCPAIKKGADGTEYWQCRLEPKARPPYGLYRLVKALRGLISAWNAAT